MKETAYVLPEGAVSSSEPQVFPGIPGRWTANAPLTLTDLGRSEDEMDELVDGTPLQKTEATVREREPGRPMVSSADLASEMPAVPRVLVDAREEADKEEKRRSTSRNDAKRGGDGS